MKTIIIDGIEYNLTPKVLFKKGAFVVIQETTYQITKVENLNVTLSLNGREYIFDMDVLKNAHLWTIQDAKDGDVLTTDMVIFIFKENKEGSVFMYCNYSVVSNSFSISNTAEVNEIYVHPATKEQRDLLFQKMKEAGYEWSDKDRKLIKIAK